MAFAFLVFMRAICHHCCCQATAMKSTNGQSWPGGGSPHALRAIDDVLGLMWIRQAARLEFVRKAKRLTILTSTGSSSDVSTLEQMHNESEHV